jgi:hypothetical protein
VRENRRRAMEIDWTAPGMSAFWTRTFHAALTGYVMRRLKREAAIQSAFVLAMQAEFALESGRSDISDESRAQIVAELRAFEKKHQHIP